MKLLSRLFKKSPPKIATIDEQIKALASQSDAQLTQVALGTSDDNLREAAIAKLPYGSELLTLASTAKTSRIQNAARKRIAQLLAENSVTLAQLSSDIPQQFELLATISYSATASAALLEQITSQALLLEIAREATTTQLRQAAAAKLTGRDALEQLAKTAQTKDKNVYKLVKAKLDAFKAGDAKLAEIEQSANLICSKLEKHIHQEADALFKAKLSVLQNEWATLSNGIANTIAERYATALGACEAKLNAQADAIAREEEKLALDQQALAFAKSAVADVQNLQRDIYTAVSVDETFINNYTHKLQELTQALRLAANRNLPLESLTKEFEYRKQQALNLLDQIKTSGTLSELVAQVQQTGNSELAQQAHTKLTQLLKHARELGDELPEVVVQAKAALNGWNQQRKEIEQSAKNAVREFSELTRKGLWAAEQGFVRKARGIQKELQEKRAQFAELPKGLQAKLDDFEQQLSKLGDWHEFAVTPKKEALIAQMQGLINSTIAPENLATKIHELQDSWKEVSKGGQQQDDDLWQQFQEASAQAYAPCKEFFEAQSAARENNLTKRREMVAQLNNYIVAYDWSNAVWKDVEKTLKVARQEWQTYWPVPRKAGNDLQKEFEILMEQLFGKITGEYESNKNAKQALIETAQSLVAADDIRAAIDAVKQLQAQWKTIGKSWHKEDQQLWEEFRQHCDAIFARRNQEINTANQQRSLIQQQAENLIAKLDAFAALDFASLTAAKADIDTLKTEFFALDLGRDAGKALTTKLQDSLNTISEKLNSERNKAEEQSWLDMFAAANAIREFELAVIAQQPTTEITTNKTKLDEFISTIPRWPTGSLGILQQRLDKAATLTSAHQLENTETLRVLTIRAEILAGRETPEQDKQVRMAYQVKQMQAAFGQRDNSFEPLVFEWIAIGGVATADYRQLLERFNTSRTQGIKK